MAETRRPRGPAKPPEVPRAEDHEPPATPEERPPPLPPERRPGEGPSGFALPPPGPARPSPPLVIALAVALVASLVTNGIVALRLRDRSDAAARLERTVVEQRRELDRLRALLRPTTGGPLEQLAAAVERLRGLRFLRAVRPELVSGAALRRRISEQFTRDNPRSKVEALDKGLTTLGLLSPRTDLYRVLLGVLEEQAGGFYDDATKRLVVEAADAEHPTPLDRLLLAHEEVHALTDQHFGLGGLDRLYREAKDDQATAFLSLVEGDATHAMFLYRDEAMTPEDRQRLIIESAAIRTDRLDAAPDVVQRFLLFPYIEGQRFVAELVRRGGNTFSLVNQAYRDRPRSTEQIIHPSLYLDRRDDPTPVRLPNVARALGRGWRELSQAETGELDVQVILDAFLTSADADRGAAGWDGGRLAVVDSSAGTLVALLTVWDSEQQAREAARLSGRWLPLRFGNTGSELRLSGAVGRGWQAPGGAGAALRDGNRMLLLIGPDAGSVQRARRAFPGF